MMQTHISSGILIDKPMNAMYKPLQLVHNILSLLAQYSYNDYTSDSCELSTRMQQAKFDFSTEPKLTRNFMP